MKKLKDFAENTKKQGKLTLFQRLQQPQYQADLTPANYHLTQSNYEISRRHQECEPFETNPDKCEEISAIPIPEVTIENLKHKIKGNNESAENNLS